MTQRSWVRIPPKEVKSFDFAFQPEIGNATADFRPQLPATIERLTGNAPYKQGVAEFVSVNEVGIKKWTCFKVNCVGDF